MARDCRADDADFLLIAEKPKAAQAIARALSDKPAKCGGPRSPPFWVLRFNGSKIVVAPSAGHLFSLYTREKGVPVFTYEWRPRHLVEKGYRHAARFFRLFEKLARTRGVVVNACDYDVEGSVIGYHIITLILGRRDYRRMKFSSLTPEELRAAFRNLLPPDSNMVESGLCRHELDWIWGINSSRLLMEAYRGATGSSKVLSAGRVQTPTLVEAIRGYVRAVAELPLPQFLVEGEFLTPDGDRVKGVHTESPMDLREQAILVARETPSECVLERLEERAETIPPPPPFNLNDLQAESFRLFKFSPLRAQKAAENLYLDGLISYPRTNSQKIPPNVNVGEIIRKLSAQGYEKEARYIASLPGPPRPRQGRKTDPAHPAIYPTGKKPGKLGPDERRLYDLIVRRFLASMMDPARRLTLSFLIRCGKHKYRGEGRVLSHAGWTQFYPAGVKEAALPKLDEGMGLKLHRARVVRRLNKKHKPYSKAGLLEWMESRGIGTEATRAPIIETLFKRGYLVEKGGRVEPTPLGMAVALVVERYFPRLTDVDLTREFEEKIGEVREGRTSRSLIVKEAREVVEGLVREALGRIGEAGEILASYSEPSNGARRCPVCGLPALESGLCLVHEESMRSLARLVGEWARREGVNQRRALEMIVSSKQVGKGVREVAGQVVEGKLVLGFDFT